MPGVNLKRDDLLSVSVSGVRWIALGRATFQVISWAMTVLVVRLLSPSDYGLAAMAGLVTTLLGMVMDAGLGPSLVQRGTITEEAYRSANGVLLVVAAIVVGLIWLVANPFAQFFHQPLIAWILRIASLQLLLSALSVAANAQLTIKMRFKDLAIIQAISGVAQGITTFGLALAGAAFWSLIIGTLVGSLVRLLFLHVFVDLKFTLRFNLHPLLLYRSSSKYMVWFRLAWFVADQTDQVLVGRLLGPNPLGLFAIAKNLSNMPLDRIAEVVNQVSLPAFSKLGDDPARWTSAFEKLMRMSSALAFPLFWGMAAVAPIGLPIILGEKWAGAVVPFALLSLPLPFRTNHALSTTALIGRSRADVSLHTVLIWAIVLTPALALGTRWGVTGVSVAWAISFPVVYLLCTILISRALKASIGMMLRPMAVPIASAILSSATAALLGLLLARTLPGVLLLGLQIICGFLVYVAAFRMFSQNQYGEVLQLVRQFMRR